MAAVSAWGKPGAWALDAEEHDAVEHKDKGYDSSDSSSSSAAAQLHKPSDEFPSLAAAAATKTKKKKGQTLSLAEFTNGGQPVTHGTRSSSSSRSLTSNELLALPTGPRERTAEELERGGRGFGYSSYGGGRGRSGEDPYPRSGSSRVSDELGRGAPGGGFNRDSAPSRADETDDWGATKRSMLPERRERGAGFFGDSQSRADDSESWISNKTAPPSSNGRGGGGFDGLRERRGGFEMFNREGMNDGGADSDTWGRKREGPSGGAAASDTWGRKREELSNGGGRPRLLLQPRMLPLANNNNTSDGEEQPASKLRSKASNPFGEARPREEVLKEKGQDWKQIDEKLESMKIREVLPDGQSFGRKGLGMGNDQGGAPEDRTERAWRKPDTPEAPPLRTINQARGLGQVVGLQACTTWSSSVYRLRIHPLHQYCSLVFPLLLSLDR